MNKATCQPYVRKESDGYRAVVEIKVEGEESRWQTSNQLFPTEALARAEARAKAWILAQEMVGVSFRPFDPEIHFDPSQSDP